ncbi:hypothetical protein I4U23_022443 [Adineta vaga]|nr:hypothetical protein I4U23_022443 [Adineta vaga]
MDASLNTKRYWFGAALLANGNVIVSGGWLNSSIVTRSTEFYSSSTGWIFGPSMNATQYDHTLTAFANNTKVLSAGGRSNNGLKLAEVYDSINNIWRSTFNNMISESYLRKSTLLGNEQILFTGGFNASGISVKVAELYDAASNSFIKINDMITTRVHHTSTLLSDKSTVLVTGGINASNYLIYTAELYNAGSWMVLNNSMTINRAYHAAVLLNDGNVLIAGGSNGGDYSFSNAEIYNVTARTFKAVGSMKYRRDRFSLTLLPSGNVLAVGGMDWTNKTIINVCELYDPVTQTWSDTKILNTRRYIHQTVLLNDSVLVIGGYDGNGNGIATSEKYYF